MSTVWPSAGERATTSVPMMVLAPGRFSTTTLWPNALPKGTDNARATTSFDPPAGNGTTSRTTLDGKGCAAAVPALNAADKSSTVITVVPVEFMNPPGVHEIEDLFPEALPRLVVQRLDRPDERRAFLRRQLQHLAARAFDGLARDILFLHRQLALREDRLARGFPDSVLQRRRPAVEFSAVHIDAAREKIGRASCRERV